MKLEKWVKAGLAIVTLALVALVVAKPSVNSQFHADYVDNLDTLEALSGSLVRNHLLVRHGEINHYDFLEADLQRMQRSAKLAAFTPEHVNDEFQAVARAVSKEYLVKLDSVRTLVELSKRGVGLLKNSTRAVDLLMTDLNVQQADIVDNNNAAVVLRLIVKLNQAFRTNADISNIEHLLDELVATDIIRDQIFAQLRLHARILSAFAEPLENASSSLYKQVEALHHPESLRAQYLALHEGVITGTTWLL